MGDNGQCVGCGLHYERENMAIDRVNILRAYHYNMWTDYLRYLPENKHK